MKKSKESPPGYEYKSLFRSQSNKMIAGVCGGVAEYFKIDPTLVRIIFAAAIPAGGLGFWAYMIGWLIIPENPEESEELESNSKSNILLILMGILFILAGMHLIFRNFMNFLWLPDWIFNVFSFQSIVAVIFISLGAYFIFRYLQERGDEIPLIPKKISGKMPAGKTLYRSVDDKKISGVCGGIGEYFNIDPTIIRIIWIIATILTLPTGMSPGLIAAYIILSFVLPEAPAVGEETK
ncbi:PspC domain-containing protein [candidate division KSB1 bacterium]